MIMYKKRTKPLLSNKNLYHNHYLYRNLRNGNELKIMIRTMIMIIDKKRTKPPKFRVGNLLELHRSIF